MRIAGLAINIGGWLIAMSGLFLTQSSGLRIILACVGIGVSLVGILGVLNKFYLARAIWKQ
jgi:hypothetical protein